MIPPIRELIEPGKPTAGVGDRDLKTLRCQEVAEPPSHLAAPADHQGPLAAALTLRRNTRLFLGCQGGLDQLP